MRLLKLLAVVFTLMNATLAFAVQPDEMLRDPALELRARVLSKELRCMVCQNQSIDDSDAPLARDLRILVRERIQSGDSDNQVLDFLVARYGEFVLLKPRLSGHTILLWAMPVGVLIAGVFALVLFARKRKTQTISTAPDKLTAAEQARLAAMKTARDV